MKKTKSIHVGYATKIWLLSASLSPALFILFGTLIEGQSSLDEITILLPTIFFGLVASIPNYLLLLIGTKLIFKYNISPTSRRVWTQILVTILWYLIFRIILNVNTLSGFLFDLPIPYLISLSIGVWLFKVYENESERTISEDKILDDLEKMN